MKIINRQPRVDDETRLRWLEGLRRVDADVRRNWAEYVGSKRRQASKTTELSKIKSVG